jgi:hypothetical protein
MAELNVRHCGSGGLLKTKFKKLFSCGIPLDNQIASSGVTNEGALYRDGNIVIHFNALIRAFQAKHIAGCQKNILMDLKLAILQIADNLRSISGKRGQGICGPIAITCPLAKRSIGNGQKENK